MADAFTTSDLLCLTSASQSNIQHWGKIQLIHPAVEEATGSGHPKRFSPLNVIECQIAATVNRFGVPTEVIRGALNVFRGFHRGAVAVHEELVEAPIIKSPAHLALFRTKDVRRRTATSFARSELYSVTAHQERIEKAKGQPRLDHAPTSEDMERASASVKQMAHLWAELRTGPLVRGVPDPSWAHFFGMFVGGGQGSDDFTYGVVALDPPDLSKVVEESALVIDLADVVFRVGERCAHLGITLGVW